MVVLRMPMAKARMLDDHGVRFRLLIAVGARAQVRSAIRASALATIDAVGAPKLAIVVAVLAFALPSVAAANTDAGVTTVLVTRAADGGLPNAASENPVVSLDAKFASILAFQSTASNLVSLPTGGVQNVF